MTYPPTLSDDRSLDAAIASIGIRKDRPVLIIVGWAANEPSRGVRDAAKLLLRHQVLPAVATHGAVIVTGGTDAGLMALVGQLKHRHAEIELIGVTPISKIDGSASDGAAPEPNHHIITTPGEDWGDEGPYLVDIAERIAGGCSITVLAMGGNDGTARELELARTRGWPTLLITGMGEKSATDLYAASNHAAQLKPMPGDTRRGPSWLSGLLRRHQGVPLLPFTHLLVAADVNDRPTAGRALQWGLSDDRVLKDAWTRFDIADAEAVLRKKPFDRLAWIVLGMATLGALAALLMTALTVTQSGPAWAAIVLKAAVTALSLIAAALLAFLDRQSRSRAWVEMRAAAESLIQTIYLYRACAGVFNEPGNPQTTLSERVHVVDAATSGRYLRITLADHRLRTADILAGVATPAWPPQHLSSRIARCDDLVGPLSGTVYDESRVLDQVRRFEDTSRLQSWRAARLAAWIFALSAVGAGLLAASWRVGGLGFGSAAAAAAAAAVISWREYTSYEPLSESRDATATLLRGARGRWLARPDGQRALRRYAQAVEGILATEGNEWARLTSQVHQSWLERNRRR